MRKRYKKKKRSCPICKPNKTNGDIRWTAKEFNERKCWEKELRNLEK